MPRTVIKNWKENTRVKVLLYYVENYINDKVHKDKKECINVTELAKQVKLHRLTIIEAFAETGFEIFITKAGRFTFLCFDKTSIDIALETMGYTKYEFISKNKNQVRLKYFDKIIKKYKYRTLKESLHTELSKLSKFKIIYLKY